MASPDRAAAELLAAGATDLDDAIAACRATAWVLGMFSAAANLLILAPPLYMLQIFDRVMTTGRVETLFALTAMVAAALLLFGLLDALRSAVTVRMGCWLSARLGAVYLANSVRARLAGDGDGAQPLWDLATMHGFVASPALTVFFDLVLTPVFLVLLWMLHPWLGVLGAGAAALLFSFGFANEHVTRAQSAKASQAHIAAMRLAEATIRNAEVVPAMNMLPALAERWSGSNDAALLASQRMGERSGWLLGLTKFVRQFLQAGVLGLGAYLVLRNEMSAGGIIAASILLGRALGPVEAAMSTWRSFASARVAYRRLKSRLEALPPEPVRTRLPAPAGVVTVAGVGYAPPRSRAPVLRGVSFAAQPGEAIAVIGPSGSGKSTLCRILVGIAEPSAGEVRLDGSDLRHWNPGDLGRHVGYLPQDVELFAGTVRENIARMGDADDDAVVEAAMLAHAHEAIQHLPQGHDTPVGDGGIRLSGGQRQRVGLARAAYGKPRLVVLDEPNANLDQAGEAALAAAIAEMKKGGATVVIVGHRPSTIAQAEKILLLNDGRVEQFGPRDEVLKRLRVAQGSRAIDERRPADNAAGAAGEAQHA